MASVGDIINSRIYGSGKLPSIPQQNLQGKTNWMPYILLGVGALVVYKFVLKR